MKSEREWRAIGVFALESKSILFETGVCMKRFRGFKVITGIVGIFGQIFRKKIAKTALFCSIFRNSALNFRAFGRKTQLVGKILRKFLMKIK